jgi:hypothetical protein
MVVAFESAGVKILTTTRRSIPPGGGHLESQVQIPLYF